MDSSPILRLTTLAITTSTTEAPIMVTTKRKVTLVTAMTQLDRRFRFQIQIMLVVMTNLSFHNRRQDGSRC